MEIRCLDFVAQNRPRSGSNQTRLPGIPESHFVEMKDIPDDLYNLRTNRMPLIRHEEISADEIELLYLLAMTIGFDGPLFQAICKTANRQRNSFKAGQSDPVLRIRHIQMEERIGEEIIQASHREQ